MVMIHIDYSNSYADPVVYNSYKFYTKTQQPDEPFDNYLSAITELAKLCEFESLEERMIRDKIIVGVNSSSLRDKLLKLENPRLNNIVEYCRLVEKEKNYKKKTVYQLTNQIVWERKSMTVSEEDMENFNIATVDVNIPDAIETNEVPVIEVIDVKQETMEEEISDDPGLVHFEESNDDEEFADQECTEIKVEPVSNYEQYEVESTREDTLASAINKNFFKLQNVFSLKSGDDNLIMDDAQESNPLGHHDSLNIKDENAPGTSETEIIYPKCSNCQNEFTSMEELEAHIEICQNQRQNIFRGNNFKLMINKNFQFIKQNLDKVNPDPDEKSFECAICKKTFRKQQSLKNHYRAHYNDGRCKCEVCGKTFGFPSELKQHSLVHSNDKPYKCNECDASFKEAKTLKTHMSVHSVERPFKCDICGKCFSRKFYLDTHAVVHTGKKPFECQGCNKGFGDITSLRRHVLIHTGEKPYKCDQCSKHFREKGALRKHIFVHSTSKPFRCEDCGKEYAQKASLIAHTMIHTGEKPFKCEICNLTCRDKATLKSHSYLHSGDSPYKCDRCTKVYRDKNTLNRHFVVHMDESPYKCNVCNASFRGRNNLKCHLYIHTGEKPYICNDCGRAFRSKSTMKEHMYRIHKSLKISKKKKRYNLRKLKLKKMVESETEEEDDDDEVMEIKENNVEIKDEESSEVEEQDTIEMDEGINMKTEAGESVEYLNDFGNS